MRQGGDYRVRPIVIGTYAALLSAGLFGVYDLSYSVEHRLTKAIPEKPILALEAAQNQARNATDPLELLAKGKYLNQKAQPDLALAFLKKAYELMPENRDLSLQIAWTILTLEATDDYPLAEEALATAQKLDPNYSFTQELQLAYASRSQS